MITSESGNESRRSQDEEAPISSSTRGPISFETYGGSAPENYRRYFVPAIGEPLARDLLQVADLGAGERVLDVACGTGVVARLAAEHVGANGDVVAVDINPGMLHVARSTTPPDVQIDWREGSAENLPLPDRFFDVVLCQMGLQFVADKLAGCGRWGASWSRAAGWSSTLRDPPHPPSSPWRTPSPVKSSPNSRSSCMPSSRCTTRPSCTSSWRPPRSATWPSSVEPGSCAYRHLRSFFGSTFTPPLAGPLGQTSANPRAAIERDVAQHWETFADEGWTLEVDVLVATARRP
ncbi:MAG: methyltransferase domain-containing protein [Actinomycetota bacterium]|nr:methyltransferase domain-containing protein [Actinomycetota bacterium]